jgi:hypothetical protein
VSEFAAGLADSLGTMAMIRMQLAKSVAKQREMAFHAGFRYREDSGGPLDAEETDDRFFYRGARRCGLAGVCRRNPGLRFQEL